MGERSLSEIAFPVDIWMCVRSLSRLTTRKNKKQFELQVAKRMANGYTWQWKNWQLSILFDAESAFMASKFFALFFIELPWIIDWHSTSSSNKIHRTVTLCTFFGSHSIYTFIWHDREQGPLYTWKSSSDCYQILSTRKMKQGAPRKILMEVGRFQTSFRFPLIFSDVVYVGFCLKTSVISM